MAGFAFTRPRPRPRPRSRLARRVRRVAPVGTALVLLGALVVAFLIAPGLGS